MTEKTKKKKETTPACNGTQLKATRHLVSSFFTPPRSANAKFPKQRRGNRQQLNTEGAVAKSASGDSPFPHRRLDCITATTSPCSLAATAPTGRANGSFTEGRPRRPPNTVLSFKPT